VSDIAHLGNLPRFEDGCSLSRPRGENGVTELIRENRDLFSELANLLKVNSSVYSRKLARFHHSEVFPEISMNLRIQETLENCAINYCLL